MSATTAAPLILKCYRPYIVGTWQYIDLGYSYGKQKGSSEMTFDANQKITAGIWKGGTWSFDPETNVLTANGVKCYLQR